MQTGRGNWPNFEQRTKVERFFLRYRAQRATGWNSKQLIELSTLEIQESIWNKYGRNFQTNTKTESEKNFPSLSSGHKKQQGGTHSGNNTNHNRALICQHLLKGFQLTKHIYETTLKNFSDLTF